MNKFGLIDNERLISIVYDFYDVDSISFAKKILIDEVDKLNLEKWPKPPTRRGVHCTGYSLGSPSEARNPGYCEHHFVFG